MNEWSLSEKYKKYRLPLLKPCMPAGCLAMELSVPYVQPRPPTPRSQGVWNGGTVGGESGYTRCTGLLPPLSSFLFCIENPPIMKSLTLPALSLPMKLVSLEEAQARSLATNHPARKERRENSLPEIVPPMGTLFHTVLELPDNK